ncbi:MAG: hypothetical protein ACD_54C00782G0002 [uncultured bacterium]|nr:MAG: hypothetical protein ACD_54C00782G0002 [uncultured bacterium]
MAGQRAGPRCIIKLHHHFLGEQWLALPSCGRTQAKAPKPTQARANPVHACAELRKLRKKRTSRKKCSKNHPAATFYASICS